MNHASPTAILLNVGHALDHWILVVFAYTWGVIAGVWGTDWTELTPFNYGALFMFGAGAVVAGRLGDLWGRWKMMAIYFAGMGVSSLIVALCQDKWQIGLALTLMGAFASIYHPVGIPMLLRNVKNPGMTIGINGLAGNMGIAIAAGVSVVIAEIFGWQMAFVLPGLISLAAAVAFVALVPRESEAPSRRGGAAVDLPSVTTSRVFAIMTVMAVTNSIIFNFTTNGNGELLKERIQGIVQDPASLAGALFLVFALASLAQLVVGRMIDRYPLKKLYLGIVLLQVPLFLIASQVQDWALLLAVIGFMLLIFGAVPFTDAMVVRYIDDRLRSRAIGMRLAIGFTVSSLVVAGIGPTVKAAGFSAILMVLAGIAACSLLAIALLPADEPAPKPAAEPAE